MTKLEEATRALLRAWDDEDAWYSALREENVPVGFAELVESLRAALEAPPVAPDLPRCPVCGHALVCGCGPDINCPCGQRARGGLESCIACHRAFDDQFRSGPPERREPTVRDWLEHSANVRHDASKDDLSGGFALAEHAFPLVLSFLRRFSPTPTWATLTENQKAIIRSTLVNCYGAVMREQIARAFGLDEAAACEGRCVPKGGEGK